MQQGKVLMQTKVSSVIDAYNESTLSGGFSLYWTSQISFVSLSSSAEYLFQLMAVLVHHGDMHSGHFVTYRRCPPSPRGSSPFSSQWLWVSDDSVRKASFHEVLSSNAYMLFYERVRRLNLALQPEE